MTQLLMPNDIFEATITGNLQKVKQIAEKFKRSIQLKSNDEFKNLPFHLAAACDHYDILKYFVEEHLTNDDINICNNGNNSALHIACSTLSLPSVKLLVEHGISINVANNDGITATHIAIVNGGTEILKYLFEHGAEVHDSTEVNFVYIATSEGYEDITKILLDKGYSIRPNIDGYTPLMAATARDHLPIVKILCEHGCRPDEFSEDINKSPLSIAVLNNLPHICEYFLQQFPDMYIQSNDDSVERRIKFWSSPNSPISMAALQGNLEMLKLFEKYDKSIIQLSHQQQNHSPIHSATLGNNKDIIKYFLQHQIPIDSRNELGNTPLHIAVLRDNKDIIEYLLEEGASINLFNNDKNNLLHVATFKNSLELVKYFIEKGINVNSTNYLGETPLHIAIYNGEYDIVEYLIDKKADIEMMNHENNNALHFAAFNGYEDIAKILIRKGCKLQIENHNGNTALMLAIINNHLPIVELLCANGCRPDDTSTQHLRTPLSIACNKGFLEICEYFLLHYPELYQETKNGKTDIKRMALWTNDSPIHEAVGHNHLNILKLLLKYDNSLASLQHGEYQNTILHLAATGGYNEIINYLLEEHKIPIDIRNKSQHTPLHFAASLGHFETASLLIQKGARLTMHNNTGLTELHYACMTESLETVKILVENGSEVNAKTNVGDIPLFTAAEYGRLHVMEFLIDHGADVTAFNDKKCNAVYYAAQGGHLKIVQMLIDKGCSFETKSLYGTTPLTATTQKGHLPIVRLLCEKEYTSNDTLTTEVAIAICLACERGFLDIVEYFLHKYPNSYHPVKQDLKFGLTNMTFTEICTFFENKTEHTDVTLGLSGSPIHLAAFNGHLEIIKLLLKCDKSLANLPYGELNLLPIHAATANSHIETIKYFIHECQVSVDVKNGLGQTALHIAFLKEDKSNIQFLLDEGASINASDNYGNTLLHYACNLSVDMIKLINITEISINVRNQDKNTALITAAGSGKMDIVKWLLDNGADINLVNSSKQNALHYAAAKGHADVAKVLIDNGCNMQEDDRGYTPFMVAIINCYLPVIKVMIDNGFRPDNILNEDIAQLIIRNEQYMEIYHYLLQDFPNLFKSDEIK